MRHRVLWRCVLSVALAVAVCGLAGPAWAGQGGDTVLRSRLAAEEREADPQRQAGHDRVLRSRLAALEREAGGRLGLALLDPATSRSFTYRGGERFALCSTFKLVLAAAVLDKTRDEPGLLVKHVAYGARDLLAWAPATKPT